MKKKKTTKLKQRTFSEDYLNEKIYKKMRHLAEKFSSTEVKWITDGVKDLILMIEKQRLQPSWKGGEYPTDRQARLQEINSHIITMEELLVELKLRYGKFLNIDYHPIDEEEYMYTNYDRLRYELEEQLGVH